ncbi:hypothetical protein [Pseudomonas sp. KCJK8993]|uniref:hypothetical protein n=1 Tax=Pseudomonas sp. KCJK8993 TaxID=3344565 RepID=UPI0039065D15
MSNAYQYVWSDGTQAARFVGDHTPPEGAVLVESFAEFWDQVWLFPGWSESPSEEARKDAEWRSEQIAIAAAQLERLEEAEAGIEVADLLPGTRKQWLAYRGQLRAWVKGGPDSPDPGRRPQRPE